MPSSRSRKSQPLEMVVAFNPNDDELREIRSRCAKACAEYNSINEYTSNIERGHRFMRILPPSASHLAPPLKVQTPFYMDYGVRVYIHETVFIERNCKIIDTPVADIKIDKYCSIGPNVTIVSTGPPPARINLKNLANGRREFTGHPVTICKGAWIGASAVIGPGVLIGEGAVVAPGAVVLDDVPAYAEARGNPAVVTKGEKGVPSAWADAEAGAREETGEPQSPFVYYQRE
ncbi:trimeric LpxA-like protein [Hypoxylon sp. NC0597]|nr:trimeric LpxA-like protein [Hypoxylon sp. NC0597]